MSLDLTAVRAFIADNLGSTGLAPLPGVNAYETIDGGQDLPAVIVGDPDRITYEKSFKGASEVELPVWYVVDRSSAADARRALDVAVSTLPGSLITALRTIALAEGAPWRNAHVADASRYGTITFGPTTALAVSFTLTIKA